MRQQIKWIAFAASFVVLMYMVAMIASFLFAAERWTTGHECGGWTS